MGSNIMENVKKKSFFPSRPTKDDDLPISAPKIGLRRRLPSFSVGIQPLSSAAAAASSAWAFGRSKSMSSVGETAGGSSLRRWWDRGWGWILSRKPAFARDLEMNGEETSLLGFHGKGSWRRILCKLRFELSKIVSGSVPEVASSSASAY